jgi:kynureninase
MEYTAGPFRWLNGTSAIPALYAAVEGPRIVRRAWMGAIRAKSMRQTARLIELAGERGYRVNAPRDPVRRGGTVALDVAHGFEVMKEMLARDILVDYRVGAGIRVAPHFFRRDDELDEIMGSIGEIIESGAWQRFAEQTAVVA